MSSKLPPSPWAGRWPRLTGSGETAFPWWRIAVATIRGLLTVGPLVGNGTACRDVRRWTSPGLGLQIDRTPGPPPAPLSQ
jgi:hypothetical protein